MKKIHLSGPLAETVFLAAILAVLVIIKWPHLFLPAFWDEAWSYLPAIRAMAASGPTLLPDPSQAELTRGHPLLFYFLASGWASLAGFSFPLLRIFPLVTAALLLVVLYRFGNKHFGKGPAVAVTLLLAIQALFLAQASLLLPEMLLALLSLLTFDAFFSEKRWLYMLWGTLLLLTKETGIAAILCCLIFGFSDMFRPGEGSTIRQDLKKSAYLLVPVLLTGLFFIVQKARMGWFLFPEHVGLIDLNFAAAWAKATSYLTFLTIYMGRSLLTFTALAAMGYLLIRKVNLPAQERRKGIRLALFLIAYLLLLSVNFYSPRYLLSALPVFLLLCVWLIIRATEGYSILRYAVMTALVAFTGWFTWDFRNDTDHNLGFADAVEVHGQVIRYCADKGWQQRPLATHFLMEYNLTHPGAGYLDSGGEFRHVTRVLSDTTEVVIITSTEHDPAFRKEVLARQPVQVIRFEKKKAFGEIFLLK